MWAVDHKAEHWRIYAFELWYWRRLLTTRRSIQSILKEITSEYSLEGLMLKLRFQYFGHLMWRTDSLEKTLMLGKIEGKRRRGWQKMRLLEMVGWHHRLEGHEFEQAPGVGDGQGSLASCSPWGHKELDMPEWLNWLTGSQKCFTKARNTLKRKRPGAPLDLRHLILISPTEALDNFDNEEQVDWVSNSYYSPL